MLRFIIVICFAFAQAERLGHNYGQGGPHNAFETRFRNRELSSNIHRVGSELNNGRSGYSANAIQSGNFAGPIEPNYNKEFYSYAAPDEDLKDVEATQNLVSAIRKNLRVVFIKAPENNAITNAAVELAKQSAESKTAIYVLTKETDIGELVNELQTIQPGPESKPVVHFVKYRTPEDAARAQQIIHNQYDALGGISHLSNEAVAPILDFSFKKEQVVPRRNTRNVNFGTMNNAALMLNSILQTKSRH